VVSRPPLPGAADRVLHAEAQREFWYQRSIGWHSPM
jgi:hypothetical protein